MRKVCSHRVCENVCKNAAHNSHCQNGPKTVQVWNDRCFKSLANAILVTKQKWPNGVSVLAKVSICSLAKWHTHRKLQQTLIRHSHLRKTKPFPHQFTQGTKPNKRRVTKDQHAHKHTSHTVPVRRTHILWSQHRTSHMIHALLNAFTGFSSSSVQNSPVSACLC